MDGLTAVQAGATGPVTVPAVGVGSLSFPKAGAFVFDFAGGNVASMRGVSALPDQLIPAGLLSNPTALRGVLAMPKQYLTPFPQQGSYFAAGTGSLPTVWIPVGGAIPSNAYVFYEEFSLTVPSDGQSFNPILSGGSGVAVELPRKSLVARLLRLG